MDRCPGESLLIRWVAGELPPVQRDALDRHAAECSACRRRLVELQRVWDVTGDIDFSPPPRDLTPTVLSAARLEMTPPRISAGMFALRLAAAVALAAGLGTVAGRLLPPGLHAPQTPTALTEAEMLDRTGLHLLAGDNVIIAHVLEMDSAGEPQQEDAS